VWTGVYPYNARFPSALPDVPERVDHPLHHGRPLLFPARVEPPTQVNVGSLVTNIYPLDAFAEAFKNQKRGEYQTLIKM